jgi:multiple antibiotic resistance protein
MEQWFSFGLVVFTAFFTIINPFGVMPVFMTMTASLTPDQRRSTAIKAILVSLITVTLFAFSGNILFDFFGISVASFRIVGGIIFFLVGYDMLQARFSKMRIPKDKVAEYVGDISVTPLAIPMIIGPGAITNAIVLMSDAKTLTHQVAFFVAVIVVLALVLLILLSATHIMKVLGRTGSKIMMRLMGLIVMVIAIEFFLSGLKPIIRDIIIYVNQ